jgi:glutamine cyclotransferase
MTGLKVNKESKIRNKHEIESSNDPNALARRRSRFEFWIFVIRVCFGFRISCFGFALLLLTAGCPSKTPKDGDSRAQEKAGSTPSYAIPQAPAGARPPSIPTYGYRVIREYPHDPCAFTQGLIYENGYLYEGTGLYGQSKLIKRDFKTWAIVKQIQLPAWYFGEGITLVGDQIIQLTWQEHTGFVYDKNTFKQIGQFTVATDGWGLTYDGRRLILSDGTNVLYFLDPNTFAETGQLHVAERTRLIRFINELEYIDDPNAHRLGPAGPQVYANILGDNRIVILSPQTGNVTAWIDLTGLYTPPPDTQDNFVLNGIAYLPESKHLLVTGKCWTKMFEIVLIIDRPGQ